MVRGDSMSNGVIKATPGKVISFYNCTAIDFLLYNNIVSTYICSQCVPSSPYAVMANEVKLLPKGLNVEGYRRVFRNKDIWRSYRNTIAYTLVGTFFNVLLTAMAAFPLSRPDFYGRKFWMVFFTFTMFFGGGLIPTYLLIQKLHLVDTFWVMIIIGLISTYNMIVMRTFFQSNVPMSLQEAAIIDGANDLKIFWSIVLPLSKPIIAVMALFYGVAHWNSFFTALIYLNSRSKYPLSAYIEGDTAQNQLSADGRRPQFCNCYSI